MPLHLKQVWRAQPSLWIEVLGMFVMPLLMVAQLCLSVCLLAAGSMLAFVPTVSGADVPPPQPTATRVSNKTLVAWVSLANTNQQGGSVLTLIDKAENVLGLSEGPA